MKNNFILFLFIIFFAKCDNYHQKSFNQLENAFINWYALYSNIDINKNNFTNFYLKKYDSISTNDYLEDLKNFSLELSQINKNKLSYDSNNSYYFINKNISYLIFEHIVLDKYLLSGREQAP